METCLDPSAGKRRVLPAIEHIVQPPADHRPVAQVVGEGPDQTNAPAAHLAHLAGCRGEEMFSGFARFAWKHNQELAAAARTQENASQTQLRQQRARQRFADKRDPLGAAGQHVFAGRAHRAPPG